MPAELWRPSGRLLARAAHNSLAAAAPQLVGLALVITFGVSHGERGTAAVGTATTVFGVAVLLSVGCAITAIRAVSLQRARRGSDAEDRPIDLPSVLGEEFGYAGLFGILGLGIAAAMTGLTLLVSPDVSGAVAWYLLGALPWMLVVPHTSVANGAFQALDRDGFNARIALPTAAGQCISAAGILLLRLPLEPSMLLVGCAGSAFAVVALAYRLRVLSRTAGQQVRALVRLPASGLRVGMSMRLAAGADGVVYMTVFFLATIVATRYSLESGAVIALAVSIMRLLIIPIKQLGLVGGRLLAQGRFDTARDGLRTIRVTAALACTAAALIVIVWGAVPSDLPLPLAILLAAQLLIEPVAGVQFAALKIAVGPAAGVRLLLVCYWLVAPSLLLLIAVLGRGEPWLIWSALLAVRLVFAAGVARITSRHVPSVATAVPAQSAR